MAERGAPEGNTNAAKGARWRAAIDRALARRSKAEGIQELDRLADKFLDEVEAQGINGYKELGDRLDGKAHQTLSGPNDSPLLAGIDVTLHKPDARKG
jgi:hypothetical protein